MRTWILVALGLAAHAALAAGGWFYWDDFTLQAQARQTGWWELMWTPHDGHLMPAGRIVVKVLAHAAYLSWPVALAAFLILQAGAAVAVLAGVREVVRLTDGPTWRVDAGLAVYFLLPVGWPAAAWFAAGLASLPVQAGLGLAMWAAARWVRMGRELWVVPAAVLGAAAFSEKALLIAPVVVAVLLLARRPWWSVAVAGGVPTLAWGALYLWLVRRESEPVGGLLGFVAEGYLRAAVPGISGTAWQWQRWHPGPPFLDAAWWSVAAGVAVLAYAAWRLRRWALLPLFYPIVPLVALYLARSNAEAGVEQAMALRQFAEGAVVAAFAVAAGWRPVRHAAYKKVHKAAGTVIAASALVGLVAFGARWWDQPARAYVANLRAAEGPVLDQDVDWNVLSPAVAPYNTVAALAPEKVASAVERLQRVQPDGTVRDAEMWNMRASESSCAGELALDGPLMDREWTVRLNYLAPAEGDIAVALDGAATTFTGKEGLHQVYLHVTGGGSTLRLSAPAGTCFGVSQVGL